MWFFSQIAQLVMIDPDYSHSQLSDNGTRIYINVKEYSPFMQYFAFGYNVEGLLICF